MYSENSASAVTKPTLKLLTVARKSTSPIKNFYNATAVSSDINNVATENNKYIEDIPLSSNKRKRSKAMTRNQSETNKQRKQSSETNISSTTVATKKTSKSMSFSFSTAYECVQMLANYAENAQLFEHKFKEFQNPCRIYAYLAVRHQYHPTYLNRNLSYCTKSSRQAGKLTRDKFKVDSLLPLKQSQGSLQPLDTTVSLKSPSKPLLPTLTNEKQQRFFNEINVKIDSIEFNNHLDRDLILGGMQPSLILEVYAQTALNSEPALLIKLSKQVTFNLSVESTTVLVNKNITLKLNQIKQQQLILKAKFFIDNYPQPVRSYSASVSLGYLTNTTESYSFKLEDLNMEPEGVDLDATLVSDSKVSKSSKVNSSNQSAEFLIKQFANSNMINLKISLINLKNHRERLTDQHHSDYIELRKTMSSVGNKFHNKKGNRYLHQSVCYQFTSSSKSTGGGGGGGGKKCGGHYSNRVVKVTAENFDFSCPFCFFTRIDSLTNLLKHLKNTHFRFCFTKMQLPVAPGASTASNGDQKDKNMMVIDITIDDLFDGSYAGNQHDLIKYAYLGYAGSCCLPTKRMSGPTSILVNRKSMDLTKLAERYGSSLNQTELDVLGLIQQQLNWQQINALNFSERVYYHSKSNLPITISEISSETSADSDTEHESEWLKEHTKLLLNEFTDVNEGEKDMMRVWNVHFLRYRFLTDATLYEACFEFVTQHADTIARLRLRNNFMLHLACLYDYEMIELDELVKLIELYAERTRFTSFSLDGPCATRSQRSLSKVEVKSEHNLN